MRALFFMAGLLILTTPVLAQETAAPPAAQSDWRSYHDPYASKATDLTQPHRTANEVSTWAQQAASDVLSFKQDNYKARLISFKKYFVASGWQPYAAWVKEMRLIDMVTQQNYLSISGIVDATPDVTSQGVAGGTYHWLVRMPAIISLQREGSADTLGHYRIFLDIQRIKEKDIEKDGLAIAGWRVERMGS